MTDEQEGEQEQWVRMTEAARLLQVPHSRLSTLVKRGTVQSKKDPLDTRLTLVNMTELRKLFSQRH